MNIDDTMTFSIDKEREEYHFRKRRKKIIKLLISLIIWAIIIIYLLTPFSSYKMMNVKGNVYLDEEEVIELAGIKNTWWWLVDSKKLKDKLETYVNIDNVSVSKGFNGLNISILEKYPLATRDGKYLMNTTLELMEKSEYPYTIDKLVDVSELNSTYVNLFANQYIHVDLKIREYFISAKMQDEKIMIIEGKFNESSYFKIYLNLDCLSIKLSSDNFNKIKSEILGKVSDDNVQYDKDNPCIVKYNFTSVYEYRVE